MQNLLGHSGGFSRNCSQLTVNCLTIVLLKFPDSDIDESAHLCSLHVLRSSGADRVTELNVVVTNLSCRRVLPACRAWRICFVSRKVLGISFKKIRHGVVNNETNRRFWYHNNWKKRYSKDHMPFSTYKHLSDDVYIEEMALQRLEGFEMETTCERANQVQINCQR